MAPPARPGSLRPLLWLDEPDLRRPADHFATSLERTGSDRSRRRHPGATATPFDRPWYLVRKCPAGWAGTPTRARRNYLSAGNFGSSSGRVRRRGSINYSEVGLKSRFLILGIGGQESGTWNLKATSVAPS